MLVNVTPSSGLLQPIIGDPHGSLVLSQTEDDGLLLRPAGGKHVRALEPPWFLVNSVDPWSAAWEFFFLHLYLGWLPSKLLVVFHFICRITEVGSTGGYPVTLKAGLIAAESQKKNLLYCMAWTTRSLHLCECLFYLGNHEPQNCLKGASPPSYLGKTWKNSKSIFSPNPTMERNLPHAETPCNQAVRPEPQLHYHFLSGVCAAWRMVNRAVKPWCQAAGAC